MAFRTLDLVGHKYGNLTVIAAAGKMGPFAAWLCRCDCGGTKITTGNRLRTGGVKSCGCLRLIRFTEGRGLLKRHGQSKTKEHRTWRGLRSRCHDKNNHAYPNYGGRGITVCKRWDSFENFLADMGPAPSPKHSIDRIDNDGPYSPENCRWATTIVQRNNSRQNRPIEYRGETRNMTEWATLFGMSRFRLNQRLKLGWSIEKALETPINEKHDAVKHPNLMTYKGVTKPMREWAKELGMPHQTLFMRIRRGWSVEDAIEKPVDKAFSRS